MDAVETALWTLLVTVGGFHFLYTNIKTLLYCSAWLTDGRSFQNAVLLLFFLEQTYRNVHPFPADQYSSGRPIKHTEFPSC
jgi:hypothetical protein